VKICPQRGQCGAKLPSNGTNKYQNRILHGRKPFVSFGTVGSLRYGGENCNRQVCPRECAVIWNSGLLRVCPLTMAADSERQEELIGLPVPLNLVKVPYKNAVPSENGNVSCSRRTYRLFRQRWRLHQTVDLADYTMLLLLLVLCPVGFPFGYH
jgi:hypothetical protein